MKDEWPRRIDDTAAQMLGKLSLGWFPGPLRITDAMGLTMEPMSPSLKISEGGVRLHYDFAEVDVETDQKTIPEKFSPKWIRIQLRGPRSERFADDEITSRNNALTRASPPSWGLARYTYELRDWWLYRRPHDERARMVGRFWVAELEVEGELPQGNVHLNWGTDRGYTNRIIRLEGAHTIYLVPSTEKKRIYVMVDTGGRSLARDELAYDCAAMQFVLGGIVRLGYLMGLNQDEAVVQACAPPISPFRGAPLQRPMSCSDGRGLSRQFRQLRSVINSKSSAVLLAMAYWHASQLPQPEQVAWSNLGLALATCAREGTQTREFAGELTDEANGLFTIASDALNGTLVDQSRQRLFEAQHAVAAAILWQAGHRESLDMYNRSKYLISSHDYSTDDADTWVAVAIGVEERRFNWARYSWRSGKVEGLLGQFEEYTRAFGRTNGPTLYATLSPRLLVDGSDRIERYQFRLHARLSPQVSVALFTVIPSEGCLTIMGWHDEPLNITTHEELISFLEELSSSSEFSAEVTNLLILAEEQNQ